MLAAQSRASGTPPPGRCTRWSASTKVATPAAAVAATRSGLHAFHHGLSQATQRHSGGATPPGHGHSPPAGRVDHVEDLPARHLLSRGLPVPAQPGLAAPQAKVPSPRCPKCPVSRRPCMRTPPGQYENQFFLRFKYICFITSTAGGGRPPSQSSAGLSNLHDRWRYYRITHPLPTTCI